MANVTKKEVVNALNKEDYPKAAKLGRAAVKHLKTIVEGNDVRLATKATYLAGLINAPASASIIETAAKSRKPVLRVAAASAAANLTQERAEPVLKRLLKSRDVGVRKCAIRSVESVPTNKLCDKLEELSKKDSETDLRKVARVTLQNMRKEKRKRHTRKAPS